MLNMFDRLAWLPVIPYIGEGKPEGNFIPYDYLLQAASYLGMEPIGEGKTYHLTDPSPYTMRELYRMIAEEYLGKTPKGTIPLSWPKRSLSSAPLRKWLHAEQEAMDYFIIDASFDNSIAAADLAESKITCPDFKDSIHSMIQFYRKYKHDSSKHISIV
ncbi:hypothetical protein [Lentibacillus sp. CBA3610]|uniref:hypothetical protein n=1 Tax=Lentibacillus sp. CBA3610 TaxID=2518176 RepID=UPI0020D261CD|nr:hypothetical protein [Lentibacillus sp. CBA3610]